MAQEKRLKQKTAYCKASVDYVVSACLIGKNCYYDAGSRLRLPIKHLFDSGRAKAVCPEQLGGLKTPRPPAEIFAGDGSDVLKGKAYVFNNAGKEVTINFIKGAKEFLVIVNEYGIKKAILKARSPSCGKGVIYDGSFSHTCVKGNGVAAALLLKNGIEVVTDEEFLDACNKTNKKKIKKKAVKSKSKHGAKKKTIRKSKKR